MKKYLAIYAIINAENLEKNAVTNREIEESTFKKAFQKALELKESIMIWYKKNIDNNNNTYISVIDIVNMKIR